MRTLPSWLWTSWSKMRSIWRTAKVKDTTTEPGCQVSMKEYKQSYFRRILKLFTCHAALITLTLLVLIPLNLPWKWRTILVWFSFCTIFLVEVLFDKKSWPWWLVCLIIKPCKPNGVHALRVWSRWLNDPGKPLYLCRSFVIFI